MTLLQAIFLGFIQGLTEFFPISSSAHLKLAKWLLSIPNPEELLLFDVSCHTGTLLSLLWFLRKEVQKILLEPKAIALYVLALCPLIPAYFLLKPIRQAASDPSYLCFSFLITSILLFGSLRPFPISQGKKWKSVLCIGVMQTIALIPGISRSGSTIAAARFCGWSWKEAVQFSFLLAIPTILGGECLELFKATQTAPLIAPVCYMAALFTSFLVGLFTVRSIFWIYEQGKVKLFAWYCLALALFSRIFLYG